MIKTISTNQHKGISKQSFQSGTFQQSEKNHAIDFSTLKTNVSSEDCEKLMEKALKWLNNLQFGIRFYPTNIEEKDKSIEKAGGIKLYTHENPSITGISDVYVSQKSDNTIRHVGLQQFSRKIIIEVIKDGVKNLFKIKPETDKEHALAKELTKAIEAKDLAYQSALNNIEYLQKKEAKETTRLNVSQIIDEL